MPVVVNISHSTLDGAVELAQAAAASGAAGLLLMPPYFFHYDEDAIRTFILRVAEQSGADVPVILYNIPQFGNPISSRLAAELISQDVVQGINDASGDREYFSTLIACRQAKEFILMAGSDILFAAMRPHKIHGVISGAACAIPELLVALQRAWTKEARELVCTAGDPSCRIRSENRGSSRTGRVSAEASACDHLKWARTPVPFSPEGERHDRRNSVRGFLAG